MGVWGYFLFGFGPVLPLLRDELEVSRTVAGLHGSLIAAGSVTAGLCYPALARRLGRGRTSWLGVTGLCAGVLLLCAGRVLPLTLAGVLLAGAFGCLVITGSGAILSDRHGPAGPAAITEANAVAAGAGVVGPALVGAAVVGGIGWRPVLALIVVPAVLLAVRLGRVRVPDSSAAAGPAPGGRLPARYWVAWLVIVAIVGIEFCMTLWSSDVLRVRAGMSPGPAAAGVTAVVAGMFAGRAAGGRLAQRYGPGPLLLAALALAGAGFALFWVSTAPAPAVAGLAVAGVGMSLHYPLAVARAIEAARGRSNLAASRISIGAGTAGGTAPVSLGALADAVGPHRAFLVVPVLIAVAATAAVASRPRARAVPAGPGTPPAQVR